MLFDEIEEQSKTEVFEFQGKEWQIRLSETSAQESKGFHKFRDLYQQYNPRAPKDMEEALIALFKTLRKGDLDQIHEILVNHTHSILTLRCKKNIPDLKEASVLSGLETGWYYYITGYDYLETDQNKQLLQWSRRLENTRIQERNYLLLSNADTKNLKTPSEYFQSSSDWTWKILIDQSEIHCFELELTFPQLNLPEYCLIAVFLNIRIPLQK